jgi:predicted hydrocarbon binding protein
MAPHTPRRSERPGEPVALLDNAGVQPMSQIENDGAGALTLNGARYLLIRPETLAALHKAMELALGPRAGECLAAGGRAGGARATAALSGTTEERARRLAAMGGVIGWGEFTLERLTADGLVVTVRRSPFAEAYGASREPVCHLTRGVLESLAVATLGRPARVTETQCAAMGAAACRFEARPA